MFYSRPFSQLKSLSVGVEPHLPLIPQRPNCLLGHSSVCWRNFRSPSKPFICSFTYAMSGDALDRRRKGYPLVNLHHRTQRTFHLNHGISKRRTSAPTARLEYWVPYVGLLDQIPGTEKSCVAVDIANPFTNPAITHPPFAFGIVSTCWIHLSGMAPNSYKCWPICSIPRRS